MYEFLRTIFDAGPFFIRAFSLIGTIISTTLGEATLQYFPSLYYVLELFYNTLGNIPFISEIWQAVLGVESPLDLTFLHLMTTAVFGLIIYRIIKWFIDIVL